MLGTITNVVEDRGYAFLIDENGVSRFLHFSNFSIPLSEKLYVGDTIIFTPDTNKNNEIAKDACLVREKESLFKAQNYEQVMAYVNRKREKLDGMQAQTNHLNGNYIKYSHLYISIENLIIDNKLKLDLENLTIDAHQTDMSMIITCILSNFPITDIILRKTGENYVVIKGEMLLTSIYMFINNKFSFFANEINPNVNEKFFNFGKSSLSIKMQTIFLRKKTNVYIIEDSQIDENMLHKLYKIM